MRVSQLVSRDCYNQTGNYVKSNTASMLHAATYSISNTKNKFTVVGFDTFASLNGFQNEERFLQWVHAYVQKPQQCSQRLMLQHQVLRGDDSQWIKIYVGGSIQLSQSHLFGTSILAAMLLLWNKANSISPLIISRTFQMKLSQWCLTGQLEMRNVEKQL